jgi:hypothetical protein
VGGCWPRRRDSAALRGRASHRLGGVAGDAWAVAALLWSAALGRWACGVRWTMRWKPAGVVAGIRCRSTRRHPGTAIRRTDPARHVHPGVTASAVGEAPVARRVMMWRLSCLGPPVHSTGLEGETAGDVRHSTAPAGGQHCPAGALTRDAYAYLYLPMTQLPRIATSVSQPRRTSPGKSCMARQLSDHTPAAGAVSGPA